MLAAALFGALLGLCANTDETNRGGANGKRDCPNEQCLELFFSARLHTGVQSLIVGRIQVLARSPQKSLRMVHNQYRGLFLRKHIADNAREVFGTWLLQV